MARSKTGYTPDTQPTNVGTSTHQVDIPVGAAKSGLIHKIYVVQTGGSASSTTVRVSLDSNANDEKLEVAEFTGLTSSDPIQHDNGGDGYTFASNDADVVTDSDNIPTHVRLYVEVAPDAGTDNDYEIRLVV